jgi:LysM repeat protein
MEFWLTYNNREETLQLPVPPSSFNIQQGNNNTTVNINSFGEFALIGKSKLASIEISSFFPSKVYSFCQYTTFPIPYDCVALIEKWRLTGRPIRLTITDTNVNMPVAIESFSYGEKDGTGDIYFSLSLKEYRFQDVAESISASGVETERAVEETKALTYTVIEGDTLWGIAKKVYGDGSLYSELAVKNSIVDINTIYVGQVLTT